MATKILAVVLLAVAAATEEDCQDAVNFIDEQGYGCNDWKGFDCKKALETHGYSTQGESDVLIKCAATCDTCPDITPAPITPPKSNCSDFGGLMTPEQTSCCAESCGAKCGQDDCQTGDGGAAACCAGWIPDHVKCSASVKAPCTLAEKVTCEKYGGIGHPSISDACCDTRCGNLCGAANCADSPLGDESCCFGSMTQICNDATQAPCYMPPGAGCYYRVPTCPALPTRKGMEGKEWTSFWHADTWGRDNRNSWSDAHVCTVDRKHEIDAWCGTTETMMAFAAGPNEASKHVEETMSARTEALKAQQEQHDKDVAEQAKKKEEAMHKKAKAEQAKAEAKEKKEKAEEEAKEEAKEKKEKAEEEAKEEAKEKKEKAEEEAKEDTKDEKADDKAEEKKETDDKGKNTEKLFEAFEQAKWQEQQQRGSAATSAMVWFAVAAGIVVLLTGVVIIKKRGSESTASFTQMQGRNVSIEQPESEDSQNLLDSSF